jgi:transcription initiation factor IIE alpha subunit
MKTAKTAAPGGKTAKKIQRKSGARYTCPTCGLIVSIDTECDCEGSCEIFCCGEAMQLLK